MKRSFFDRLSSGSNSSDTYDSFDDDLPPAVLPAKPAPGASAHREEFPAPAEGQLPVDLYQTPSEIVVRAFVAGVRPDELSVSIRRDMVEIEGSRMEREQIAGPDYFTRELFWGSFSRSILLPEEVDVEASSAAAKDGLLTIIMPKLDKARQTKLKVKAG
jgi:HSP20 family protein